MFSGDRSTDKTSTSYLLFYLDKREMKINKVYLWEHQIRPHKPNNVERYYNFAWKSLADFKANWWYDIVTNGSYTINADGIKQTSSSNDRSIVASVVLPDISTAKKIEVYQSWYYKYANRSNWKEILLSSDWTLSPTNYLRFTVSFTSNSWYRTTDLALNWTSIYSIQQQRTTWLTEIKMIIDFENKTVQTIVSWANTWDRTDNLTDEQLTAIKALTYVEAQQGRWYSSENNEYIQSMWYKIYF